VLNSFSTLASSIRLLIDTLQKGKLVARNRSEDLYKWRQLFHWAHHKKPQAATDYTESGGITFDDMMEAMSGLEILVKESKL